MSSFEEYGAFKESYVRLYIYNDLSLIEVSCVHQIITFLNYHQIVLPLHPLLPLDPLQEALIHLQKVVSPYQGLKSLGPCFFDFL